MDDVAASRHHIAATVGVVTHGSTDMLLLAVMVIDPFADRVAITSNHMFFVSIMLSVAVVSLGLIAVGPVVVLVCITTLVIVLAFVVVRSEVRVMLAMSVVMPTAYRDGDAGMRRLGEQTAEDDQRADKF